jgi:hypothetical protein
VHRIADADINRIDTAGVHRSDRDELAADLGVVGGHVELVVLIEVDDDGCTNY